MEGSGLTPAECQGRITVSRVAAGGADEVGTRCVQFVGNHQKEQSVQEKGHASRNRERTISGMV